MRFERLVIEAGDNTFSLDFHNRLTVISGVGRMEREGLISELIGSLSSSRAGVHAEVVADNGNRFAIFRPHGARHRVVDVEASVDVSSRFENPSGEIDLLEVAGLDVRSAKRQLRLSAQDLDSSTHHDQIVRRLASVDPGLLWSLAHRVQNAQAELDSAADSTGSVAEDAAVVARVEQRHQEFERAQATAETYRRVSFFIGAAAAIAAVPAVMIFGRLAAMACVIVAGVVTAASFLQNQRMQQAQRAEDEALADAGARSYLGFHLQRVSGLLDTEQSRSRIIQASAELEKAKEAWHEQAGEVTVEWAFDYRDEIEQTADVLGDMQAYSTGTQASETEGDDAEVAELAHVLIGRLNDARTIGPAGESLPLILDDPLIGLRTDLKPALLEMLVRTSGAQQIVFLTEDSDVIDWARVEAMTGEISILEPTPTRERVDSAQDGIVVV